MELHCGNLCVWSSPSITCKKKSNVFVLWNKVYQAQMAWLICVFNALFSEFTHLMAGVWLSSLRLEENKPVLLFSVSKCKIWQKLWHNRTTLLVEMKKCQSSPQVRWQTLAAAEQYMEPLISQTSWYTKTDYFCSYFPLIFQ